MCFISVVVILVHAPVILLCLLLPISAMSVCWCDSDADFGVALQAVLSRFRPVRPVVEGRWWTFLPWEPFGTCIRLSYNKSLVQNNGTSLDALQACCVSAL